MALVRRAWSMALTYRRAYITLNIIYYGLVALGMAYVSANPAVQQALVEQVGSAFTEGPLSAVGGAYGGGQILAAMALTFVVNLVLGTVLVIGLPSLIIPFSGILMGVYRAVLWGLMLSPSHPGLRLAMIPHSLTLLLEGQAYIVAMLAAYVHGRAFLWPKSAGVEGHGRGYVEGLKRGLRLYLLVTLLLLVAAVYEALEVILLVPLLT